VRIIDLVVHTHQDAERLMYVAEVRQIISLGSKVDGQRVRIFRSQDSFAVFANRETKDGKRIESADTKSVQGRDRDDAWQTDTCPTAATRTRCRRIRTQKRSEEQVALEKILLFATGEAYRKTTTGREARQGYGLWR